MNKQQNAFRDWIYQCIIYESQGFVWYCGLIIEDDTQVKIVWCCEIESNCSVLNAQELGPWIIHCANNDRDPTRDQTTLVQTHSSCDGPFPLNSSEKREVVGFFSEKSSESYWIAFFSGLCTWKMDRTLQQTELQYMFITTLEVHENAFYFWLVVLSTNVHTVIISDYV